MTPDEKLNMTPYEKLNMVLDIFKKTAYYEMESIEQKDIVNKLSDLLSDVIGQKVDINGDGLSSDMKVTIERKV
jgi:hypothetical protein